ncbi:MAG: M20/M25/M40 family metallo-hydrolase, partial [Acidobacteriaceae bacterium]|nr:M20/M25/M40 family metallo-hydrolase [Acidobacteriaceae bacterium]
AAKEKTTALDSGLVERILAEVREEELVSMCCDVINIPSPTGEELKMAEYMRTALSALGLTVTWQDVEDGRANVIARWEGASEGPALMFNGHMDTSNTGDEPFLTGLGYKPNAVVRGGVIYGLGIYNMKGALCCYTHAVKALQRAGVRLSGDVIVGAVAGEIEKTQWGEFTGRQYRGYGVGTHYLVNHGVLPDMCILGEPTDMKVVLEHSGSMWARISTKGIYVHTAFAEGREHQNALNRMHDVMDEVLRWSAEWCDRTAFGGHQGVVNLGCLRAGDPWRASRTPPTADLFLDVRVPPHIAMTDARREVKKLVNGLKKRFPDYGIDFETYVAVPGATISGDHAMVKAIEANHARVTGAPPGRDTVLWCSDASVMSRFGVPTVNYGPSSGPRDAEGEKVAIKTLVEITKIYALTAAEICGVHA